MSEANTNDQQNLPAFGIEKFYVKDISLEIPHAPAIFMERENPQMDMQLHTQATPLGEGYFEVVLTITATTKLPEKDQVMYLIEVKQAGIFLVRNVPESELEGILAVMCPNILYPYAREVVSDISVRAGFAPLVLQPVNFEALYAQQQQQAQAATH
ncbi:MAG: protein-export chaperone SecB [Pseudomonadota bacterium]|jgi:preprotein translocase subunit SecB